MGTLISETARQPKRFRSAVCSSMNPSGLDAILQTGKYDALLLDQFGVLHDGQVTYEGSIEAVRRAYENGIKIAIVSNTSRRSAGCAAKLEKYGFKENWFAAAVTSGELCAEVLSSRREEFNLPVNSNRAVHTNWIERGTIDILGQDYKVEPVGEDIEAAHFVLCHGTEGITLPDGSVKPFALDQLNKLLGPCVARNLPLVCANPDIVTVDGPQLIVMPGTLAREYRKLGGKTILLGKPEEIVYESACKLLGIQDRRRLLAIGDSLEHDIVGAQSAGVDTLFIAGGIFASELGVKPEETWTYDEGRLCDLIESQVPEARLPEYVLPFLRW